MAKFRKGNNPPDRGRRTDDRRQRTEKADLTPATHGHRCETPKQASGLNEKEAVIKLQGMFLIDSSAALGMTGKS